jgi:hypothetical protein
MRSFLIYTSLLVLLGCPNQGGYEMGKACSMHERDEKCIQNFNMVISLWFCKRQQVY